MVHALPSGLRWNKKCYWVILQFSDSNSLQKKKKFTHVGLVCYLEPSKILDLLIKSFGIANFRVAFFKYT